MAVRRLPSLSYRTQEVPTLNTKKQLAALTLTAALLLTGCGKAPASSPTQLSTTAPTLFETLPTSLPQEEPATSPTETAPEGILVCETPEQIISELAEAMSHLRQPRELDISALNLENPEMEAKNFYYSVTAQQPELKYAYDLTAEYADGVLRCTLHYMPYVTGAFPEDFSGVEVSSLEQLIDVSENGIGESPLPVRITDPSLDPDLMNRALFQVGSGYLYCALNRDGTAVTYSAPAVMTMQECQEAIAEENRLAQELVSMLVTDTMSQMEAAQTLYAFLTQNVTYDQRYYTDKASMPFISQTALGALRDGTAICGGYSNALRLLFLHAGIPCYTVSGTCRGENHMWNAARIDGQWLWFDATADRGLSPEKGLRHFALSQLEENVYIWQNPSVTALTGLRP